MHRDRIAELHSVINDEVQKRRLMAYQLRHIGHFRPDLVENAENAAIKAYNLPEVRQIVYTIKYDEAIMRSLNLKTGKLASKVEAALIDAGIVYVIPDNRTNVSFDFLLVEQKVYISVSEKCTERSTKQLTNAMDIIYLQGERAVDSFCMLLRNRL